jgi:hypothetical protein
MRGEASLFSAVVLNMVVLFASGAFIDYLISQEYLPTGVTSISSLRELGSILVYFVLVLPFDYFVWACAPNAKRKVYFLLGRLFALKHIPFILLLAIQSI